MLAPNPRYRWSDGWQQWVPLDEPVVDLQPLGTGPLLPETHRCNSLSCLECWNNAVRDEDLRKQLRLERL